MNAYTLIPYDNVKFDFVRIIKDLFETYYLEGLHEHVKADEYKELFEVGHDSSTIFHKKFYDKFRAGWPELQNLYDSFVKEISYLYHEDFLYQAFPTFRVHLPNNVAVGAFHNDAEFHHPDGETNYIIPLTKSTDTASCWVETQPGKKDFYPMTMIPGFIIAFNGNKLTHGNKVNLTGATRVSMDFRILPISKYDENNSSESITTNTKFKEGQYYKRFSKNGSQHHSQSGTNG